MAKHKAPPIVKRERQKGSRKKDLDRSRRLKSSNLVWAPGASGEDAEKADRDKP